MKKLLLMSIVLISLLAMMGCTTSKEMVVQEPVPVTNSKLDSLPSWILSTPKSADMHYAIGTAKAANLQTSIKRAEAEGRTSISEWIQTSVKEVIKTYVNDAGSGDNRQNVDAFEAISVQVSESVLNGVTREKLYQADDGTVYVLMAIPLSNVEKAFEPASQAVSQAFEENEAAEAANQKMADAFAKLLNGEI
ncbi:MAG: hypothetical protein PQJ45_09500 [Sphaerochaetaceae bacterium]|nr:hypothetical protein [Sphaerochaetaceae bacterium]MDC7237992.1 hypothetical protein [Sphaerochaetaceae bacterium]